MHNLQGKCTGFGVLVIVLLGGLAAYLYYVQVTNNEPLAEISERQQSRLSYIPAKRGAILDRNNAVLNTSIPQYDIAIRLDKLRDPRDTISTTLDKAMTAISELAIFLGPDFYLHRPRPDDIQQHIRMDAPLPFTLWTNLDVDTKSRFMANRRRFPAAELTLTWCRLYEYGNAAAHIRGYVNRAPIREGMARVLNFYDVTGATGIELTCDKQLSGTSGLHKYQTDVMSFRHTTIETKPAVPGEAVRLTIDINLQIHAETLLQESGHPGAIVLMDATNGECIVMASSPAYHLPPRKEDSTIPGSHTNRATAAYYPPGSTIKPLIALEALEQNLITPETTFHCPGYFTLPDGRRIRCSSKNGHGNVNVTEALAMSCNTFFCQCGLLLGKKGFTVIRNDAKIADCFGQRTGTVLPAYENAGVFFTPFWVETHRFDDIGWYPGDSANASIGQGAWIVTPIQMAVYACAICTGKVIKPKLLMDEPTVIKRTISWPDHVWLPVRQGLLDCVQTPSGTGRRLGLGSIPAFAKTGTAEHATGREPHAWMFVVAPADKPRFVAVGVLEEAGHGGELVAPILGDLLNIALHQ